MLLFKLLLCLVTFPVAWKLGLDGLDWISSKYSVKNFFREYCKYYVTSGDSLRKTQYISGAKFDLLIKA